MFSSLKNVTRREFVRAGGVWLGSFALQSHSRTNRPAGPPSALRAETLAPFVDALPIPSLARPAGIYGPDREPLYPMTMQEVRHRVHRDLPPTRLWSFGAAFPGPTLDVRSGSGIWIDWINALPRKHFLPVDHTIHGAEADLPEVRAVVHVHGARVRPEHDGYPEHWSVPGESRRSHYPNEQAAATLWYHDHTMGINRLNTYAGLLGAYLIRDAAEDQLNLPTGRYDVPLVLCDRLFMSDGQLLYPTSGDPGSPWVPEVLGDALLINGKLFPYLAVEPRKYRFRIVNASNARFLFLSLSAGQAFSAIASDQGLLERPVALTRIELAPAERAELVVDFASSAGKDVVLYNSVSSVMQFRVAPRAVEDPSALPLILRTIPRLQELDAVRTRSHEIGEEDDMIERPTRMLLNGLRWHMPVTEDPRLHSVEVWNLVNSTDDTHPIHLHLVRFQILDRRPFDVFAYQNDNRIEYTGAAVPPAPDEAGWKDTVRVHPQTVTRIIIEFDGYAGRYMWHCHLLEHGDNEMMRPMDITPA